MDDDLSMRKSVGLPDDEKSVHFDSLRKNYRKRRELNNFEVELNFNNEKLEKILKVLRVN